MKNKIIRILLLYLLLSIFTTSGFFVLANKDSDEDFYYKQSTLKLLPEFSSHPNINIKEPTLLISYQGTLYNNSSSTIDVIQLPLDIDNDNMEVSLIMELDVDDNGIDLDYTAKKNLNLIELFPTKPIHPNQEYTFFIEYYITPFNEGDMRNYTYTLTSNANIKEFNVYLYPPLGATYFETNPIGINKQVNGMESFYYNYQNINKGEFKHFSFSYYKNNNIPTVDLLLNHSENSLPENDGSDWVSIIFFITLLIFLLIIIFVIYKQKKLTTNSKQLKELRTRYVNGEIENEEYIRQLEKLLEEK